MPSKGRKTPPAAIVEYKPAAGLGACECEQCALIDRVLGQEQDRLEARALAGYKKAGRGVVEVHLCKDCGKHLAEPSDTHDGIEYTSQYRLLQWDAHNGALIANYDPYAEYIVIAIDHSTDKMTARQIPYKKAAPLEFRKPGTTPSA